MTPACLLLYLFLSLQSLFETKSQESSPMQAWTNNEHVLELGFHQDLFYLIGSAKTYCHVIVYNATTLPLKKELYTLTRPLSLHFTQWSLKVFHSLSLKQLEEFLFSQQVSCIILSDPLWTTKEVLNACLKKTKNVILYNSDSGYFIYTEQRHKEP